MFDLLVAAAMANSPALRALLPRFADNKRDHAKGAANSIASRNRWTGQPHEHRREIARRQRQAREVIA